MNPRLTLLICALSFIVLVEYLLVRAAGHSATRRGRVVFAVLAAIPPAIWVAFFAPDFVKARPAPPCSRCVANLKVLVGAKATWALDNHLAGRDTPLDSDLFGPDKYLREKPQCPEGGVYRLGAVAENPTCSLGGTRHSLDDNMAR